MEPTHVTAAAVGLALGLLIGGTATRMALHESIGDAEATVESQLECASRLQLARAEAARLTPPEVATRSPEKPPEKKKKRRPPGTSGADLVRQLARQNDLPLDPNNAPRPTPPATSTPEPPPVQPPAPEEPTPPPQAPVYLKVQSLQPRSQGGATSVSGQVKSFTATDCPSVSVKVVAISRHGSQLSSQTASVGAIAGFGSGSFDLTFYDAEIARFNATASCQ